MILILMVQNLLSGCKCRCSFDATLIFIKNKLAISLLVQETSLHLYSAINQHFIEIIKSPLEIVHCMSGHYCFISDGKKKKCVDRTWLAPISVSTW